MNCTGCFRARVVLIVCLILWVSIPGFCEKQVGSVRQITGSVLIDAFGTGDFIDAEVDEPIYEQTVLRTGYESEAEIIIQDEPMLIPAEVEVKVESILITHKKKKKFGWFSSVFTSIKRLVGVKEENDKELVLGGRAAEVESSTTETTWIFEDEDDNTLFQNAIDFIDEERYCEALEKLDAIFFTPDKALPGEVAFLKGHAYYSLGLFDASTPSFEEALEEIEDFGLDVDIYDFYTLMLFELGSAYYMVDNFDDAETTLSLVIKNEESELVPYAYLVLTLSVKDSGRSDEANRIARKAAEKYKDTRFAAEFDALISSEE